MNSMTFNGLRKEWLVTLRGKKRPPWAPLERKLLYIPGMPGAYDEGLEIKPRPLSVPVLLESTSLVALQKMKEELGAWLVTDGPKELIFDDEPDRVYFAELDGATDIDEIIRVGVGMLEFICPDPFKYSLAKTTSTILADKLPVVILKNAGTAPTYPVFDIELTKKTTYLDIVGQKDYMRIGRPMGISTTPVDSRKRILWDDMSTLTNWVKATHNDIDGGVVMGNMVSNGFSMSQPDFGMDDRWHGDARIKSLGMALTDFEVEYKIQLMNTKASTVGRIELYLFDANKKSIGKLSLKDNKTGRAGNVAELRIGDATTGKFLIAHHGSTIDTWLNFDGILKLQRVKNVWTAYVAKIVNGKHTARATVTFEDKGQLFTGKLAYVAMHLGVNGSFEPATMRILDLKVYDRVDVLAEDTAYIGEAGDIFTFDHKNKAIYKNGELFMKKDFGARFFPLYGGDNVLQVEPSEAVLKVDSEWRDAYK